MAETKRDIVDRRMGEMDLELNQFLPHYRELTDFLSPRTARYLTVDANKGQKANQKIINSAAIKALRTLKSGMHAGMTSPARPWFRLMTTNSDLKDSGEVKQWLYIVEEKMRVAMARSNFYSIMPIVYGSLGQYGTACGVILEDDETLFRVYTFPTGSYRLALDETLRVDTIYRKLPMTVRQIVRQFGIDNVSRSIKDAWDRSNYQTVFEIGHAIEKNEDFDPKMLSSKYNKFKSCYWELSSKEKPFLSESGYDEYPGFSPRWDVYAPDDVYGFSPGMDALGSVKSLQLMERRKAEAVGKMVRPPMLGDSSLRTTGSSIIEGGITYIDNLAAQQHAGFRPAYQFQPNVNELRADINEIRREISEIFYEDLMLMFATSDSPQITAREVEERHQEKLLILGPVLERENVETFDPAIKRIFAIMNKRGEFPPPPAALQGETIKVEYTSIMAQAQKLVGVAGLERVTGYVGNLIQLGYTDAADIINTDEAIREYAGMYGTPPTIINGPEVVQQKRALKAKAAQQQQAAEMMPMLNQGAQAAQTLSTTDMSQLDQIRRMMSGQ